MQACDIQEEKQKMTVGYKHSKAEKSVRNQTSFGHHSK